MLTLYGAPSSRASRCIWMLEEIGAAYELVDDVDPKRSDYLAINPNGKVPCLVDGVIVVWESMAINLYLAQLYRSALSPAGRRELGDALKWTIWAQSELEAYFNQIEALDEVAPDWLNQALSVLQTTLAGTPFLLGDRFTVADLNVSAMFMGPISHSWTFPIFLKHNHGSRAIMSALPQEE